ncbi:MAG: nitrous oxide reductase accessory protein NosL [Thermodesulfobacteriota bacterium]
MKTVLIALLLFLAVPTLSLAEPAATIGARERCPVCGMFVAKYPNWITQVRLADGTVRYFDGMKDLLAYHFQPAQYGGKEGTIREIWAKDYYTLAWLDARAAFFVAGSDVYGPMGVEFIPFVSEKAAQAFARDHHGKQVLPFAAITEELVNTLRTGQQMRH